MKYSPSEIAEMVKAARKKWGSTDLPTPAKTKEQEENALRGITEAIAGHFNTTTSYITEAKQGHINPARRLALYLAVESRASDLRRIGAHFGCSKHIAHRTHQELDAILHALHVLEANGKAVNR